jgi:hypothetical protein
MANRQPIEAAMSIDTSEIADLNYLTGRKDAFDEAIAICEGVRARWATFHSVAPSAAEQCRRDIEKLRVKTFEKLIAKESAHAD